MSITNIERMVESLVRDEMNYVRTMSLDEMDSYVETIIRNRYEMMDDEVIEPYYEEIA